MPPKKLTRNHAKAIRATVAEQTVNGVTPRGLKSQLATKYGVSPATITQILKGAVYKD